MAVGQDASLSPFVECGDDGAGFLFVVAAKDGLRGLFAGPHLLPSAEVALLGVLGVFTRTSASAADPVVVGCAFPAHCGAPLLGVFKR